MRRLTFTLAYLKSSFAGQLGRATSIILLCFVAFQPILSGQSCPLACNDRVQVSLDDECNALITPDMILEAPGISCNYIVQVFDRNGQLVPGNTVDQRHIGQTLQVSVFLGNNSCWGSIVVEDKLAPQIFCSDDLFVSCADTNFIPPLPEVDDNCDQDPELIVLSDEVTDLPCDFEGYSARRVITYRAVDRSGNYSTTCQQVIWYERRTLSDIEFPPNWDGIDTVYLTCDNIDPEWDLNGNYYPDPEETGAPTIDGFPIFPTNKGYCEINVTFTDQVLPICPKSFKVLRKWTIVDWCAPVTGTSFPPNPYEYTQIIKVVDDEAPIVVCPPSFTVSTDIWTCTGSTFAPPPTVLFECNDWDYEVFYKIADPNGRPTLSGAKAAVRYPNGLYYLPDLPLGRTWIIYKITDACGNSIECASEVDVEDEVPPTPVCDEHTVVSLTADGTAKAAAITFDDGSIDNCEVDFFEARRMDFARPCGLDIRQFAEFVHFCCEDIGNTLMIELRVWDRAGNSNTCMVEVNVQDKLPPFIQCPPNITISCEYDYEFLNEFGTVRDNKDDREPIVLNDRRAEFGGPAIDGYAADNCDVVIVTDSIVDITCGKGTIRRIFRARDPQGLTSSCTQIITFRDYDPNNITITPPLDYERLVTCVDPKNTHPDSTGRPKIEGDDKCSMIAINYKDEEFVLEPDACLKILRTWTIIDWCNYDQSEPNRPFPYGRWTHTQIIKISNNIPPEFIDGTCNNRTFDTFGPGCGGELEIIGAAEDDCTPEDLLKWTFTLDLFNDGTIDTVIFSNDATMFYPVGTHKVRWEVEDQCGNVNKCDAIWRVRDAKKPTPYCLHGISTAVMPSTETLEIWASDFNLNSEDNCTAQDDLRFFFEVNGIFTPSIIFDCSHIGENTIRMYVVDESGNSDYCETYLVLTDPNNVCTTTDPMIAGNLSTEEGERLSGADVFLDRSSPPSQKIVKSSGAGEFEFRNLTLQNGYSVYAKLNTKPLNGVSTRDIVAIQRHLLGLAPFNNAYKVIASDINNDSNVSAKDLVELRKLILGINNQFLNGQSSWRFVPKNFTFSNPDRPFPFAEQIVYDRLRKSEMATNFVAVKIGDVTGDAKPNALIGTTVRSLAGKMVLEVDDVVLKRGDVLSIPVFAGSQADVAGMQVAIASENVEWLGVEPAALKLTNDMVTVREEQLLISYGDAYAALVTPGDVLFYVTVRANSDHSLSKSVSISEKHLTAEAYNDDLEDLSVSLNIRNASAVVDGFDLYQNTPNPFADYTEIGFRLPMASEWTLAIFDVTGKLVKRVIGTDEAGVHTVRIEASDLGATGILYYQLDTEGYTATRKMVSIR